MSAQPDLSARPKGLVLVLYLNNGQGAAWAETAAREFASSEPYGRCDDLMPGAYRDITSEGRK